MLKQINYRKVIQAEFSLEQAIEISNSRLLFVISTITALFFILIARLYFISFSSLDDIKVASRKVSKSFSLSRANILDRNGEMLATNITTASVYVEPKNLINHAEVARKLAGALPDVKYQDLIDKFAKDRNFVWIKRHLTPKEQQIVHNLGIPGLYFTKDEKRIYPHGSLFSHAVGFVDIDGKGLAGFERYLDDDLNRNPQQHIQLSLDARVQTILKDELLKAVEENSAVGGSGLIMDVKSGEILALVSLPDFNPHNVEKASDRQRFNQITLGTYELGSVFKILTSTMALDLRKVNLNDAFNVSMTLQIGRFKINDYKGKGGMLSVPEVLMYSSNIGTAQIAALCGIKNQQEYLRRFGILDEVSVELKEVAKPRYPSKKRWNEVSMVTISYGYGIAVTPLHLVQAVATVVNGGYKVKPTLHKVDPKEIEREQVISEDVSILMRKMLRLVVTGGSGKRANVEGYFLGGKSGTAEKISGRRYNKNLNLSSFIAAYPIHDPKYVIMVLIDEAKPNKSNHGYTTGGMVASPVAGEVVKRISPLLNVYPENELELVEADLQLDYMPRYQRIASR